MCNVTLLNFFDIHVHVHMKPELEGDVELSVVTDGFQGCRETHFKNLKNLKT